MTIDEAYNTCFGNPYIVPIDEHEEAKRIIRDVMEELKAYRKIGTVEECKDSVLDIQKAYNKAIDDFVKALCIEYAPVSDKMQKEYDNVCLRFERIAEQLKEGRKNENYNKEES